MTSEVGEALGRSRNSLLAALELFRELSVPSPFNSLLIFLYVCENEGLSVSELAYIANLLVPRAARLVKTLAGAMPEEPVIPDAVLFDVVTSPTDRRLRYVYLTERGRRLRDHLEQIIGEARPIVGRVVNPDAVARETIPN